MILELAGSSTYDPLKKRAPMSILDSELRSQRWQSSSRKRRETMLPEIIEHIVCFRWAIPNLEES